MNSETNGQQPLSLFHDIELIARIVEHTPAGIVILDPERRIRYANSFATHLFQCDRETLVGAPIEHFLGDRTGTPSWQEFWTSVTAGNTVEKITGISRRSGSDEAACAVTAFQLGRGYGRQDAVALVFRDITHELKIAGQLEKKNIEMAKINSELIRSNMELKRLSERKSNFLSIASHELRTPLTAIKGYSDLIVDGMKEKVDAGVFRMIESISRAAGRLHVTINNMLDVTRMEQNKLRLKPERFSLQLLARESLDELAELAAQRRMTFNNPFNEDLPLFFGDRMRMHQVLTNLFSNAIKFSPDGSQVDVSIAFEEGEQFHIAVRDRGIGIDKGEQRHVFDPFYDVADISKHSSDKNVKFMGGGIGLGLSIAKGIVERHGGRIWVESPGARPHEFPGSTFHVVLPMRSEIEWDDYERSEEETKTPAAVPLASRPPANGDQKPLILLVVADRETAEVARMVLDRAFDLLVASSGAEGLPLAFQYKPLIIIIDSALQGIDGFRVCSILKSQEETRDTTVIFLSSAIEPEEIERCFEAGADDFIVKPFNGMELMDKLWRILMKKKEEEIK